MKYGSIKKYLNGRFYFNDEVVLNDEDLECFQSIDFDRVSLNL